MIDQDERMLTAAQLDPAFVELAEQITDRLQAGEEVDVRDYTRRHPQWASAILKLLPTMSDLVDYGRSVARDHRREQRQKPRGQGNCP